MAKRYTYQKGNNNIGASKSYTSTSLGKGKDVKDLKAFIAQAGSVLFVRRYTLKAMSWNKGRLVYPILAVAIFEGLG